ncbi:MAG: chorismate synthase [Promethearchaeota archaeon]|nr:MAG: chorismate synthase [Candidatus Lokiarchaeota archaeon]
MADNSFGRYFTITSFGESHGQLVGIIIDGVPAGIELNLKLIQNEMDRRRPGQSKVSTERKESDKVQVLSGIFQDKTTGAPICMIIKNKDIDSSKYEEFKNILRPSHIDYTALKKYGGYADYRGSGRFSGRITAGFVMAGALAKSILKKYDIEVFAYTKRIGNIEDKKVYDLNDITALRKLRENSIVRCLDKEISELMIKIIEDIKKERDSIGGIIKCVVKNFPPGIGGPLFHKLDSDLSHAIFSIPAIKGIEFGAGFKAARMRGSEHNDPWKIENDKIRTSKNDAGGILGGISTGMPIEFNIVVKPTSSIGKKQDSVNMQKMENITFELTGRHDPCIVPRVVVVVEAMTAITLLDHLLLEGKIPKVFEK